MPRRFLPALAIVLAVLAFAATARAAVPQPADSAAKAGEEFFERSVRPLLARHCFACHGPKKQESELRLDSRRRVLRGGSSGAAVVPGVPERSLLLEAVGYEGDIQMPPKGKLADEEVEVLRRWVQIGAPWPDAAADAPSTLDMAERMRRARAEHWSFQPIRRPPIPEVKNTAWPQNAIDRFVLARQEARGLVPAARADRRTLLRRASFDLTGLPPTQAEVLAFERDTAPGAFARVLDRLLASPRYGQRWARHWLDVARYADTKGYALGREPRYPFAYTYRDWVVDALNEDLPYDRFILQQLAADRLPRDDNRSLAALGFLTVGRRFNNRQQDIIDDRIDVVSRGLMGLSVHCARCHDHKYDPVSTADYYSLYGVFASCREPADAPILREPDDTPQYRAYKQELAARWNKHDDYRRRNFDKVMAQLRGQVAGYLAAAAAREADPAFKGEAFLSLEPDDLRPSIKRRWKEYLAEREADDPVFGAWVKLARLPAAGFAGRAAEVLSVLESGGDCNRRIAAALRENPPASMLDVATIYGRLLGEADAAWRQALKQPAGQPPEALEDKDAEQLRQVLYGAGTPYDITIDEVDTLRLFDRVTRNKLRELKTNVESHMAHNPAAPPRPMMLVDAEQPVEPRIFVRGNHLRPGKAVPRQFLEVLSGPQRKPFTDGSGRLELARAIASPDNPLTARVLVNRVWRHHFGAGLTRTPSDFGARGDRPSHPELLDWLTAAFIADGWSLKKLHRRILLSATWQQGAAAGEGYRRIDPENRLLWEMRPRRLEFEPLRDALLAAAGTLDARPGGPAVDLFQPPYSRRRTLYGFIDRQHLPGVLRAFDVASPDATSPKRPQTTVPQQALFVMNSPLVIEQAKALAARPQVASPREPGDKVQALYRLALARDADPQEAALALAFVASAAGGDGGAKLTPWEQLAQVLLCSNEFAFVD